MLRQALPECQSVLHSWQTVIAAQLSDSGHRDFPTRGRGCCYPRFMPCGILHSAVQPTETFTQESVQGAV